MKKIFLLMLVSVLSIIPFKVAAQNDFVLISQETKYYKTITYYKGDTQKLSTKSNSVTIEITEKEYNEANVNNTNSNPTVSETTYKKMTSYILSNGSYYRYKNVLSWKNMPSVRSYDIIGIGFLQSVKIHNNTTYFEQYYCYTGGSCYTTSTNYPQIFVSGAGTSFKLPTGDINTLKQTFYFDVEKNTSSTITTQKAYSDYSHATSSISLANSKKYSVIQSGGIVLDTGVSGYYDSIAVAEATWTGSW